MFARLAPITTALIIANVAVFALQFLIGDPLIIYLALWPLETGSLPGVPPFQVWQLVSYAFLHGGSSHLFFNMLALFMFGSEIERLFGPKRFAIYYLVCVIGAAAAQLFINPLLDLSPAPVVGASGGVFGLLLAFGMAYPKRRIMLLFPPIPMPAWLFVTLYGVLELVLGVTRTAQGIAHFAHLGGMAAGWVLIMIWTRHPRRPA